MPSTCRPWSPCATTQTSSGSMKSSGRPESHQSWPSPPSCESSSSSQTPSSETSAAGSAISLDQHGYSNPDISHKEGASGLCLSDNGFATKTNRSTEEVPDEDTV